MRVLIDTSSITDRRTGTGIYTQGLLRSLLLMPAVEQVIAIGGQIDSDAFEQSDKLVHHFPGDTRWHNLLNNAWTGNRFNWKADLAFFPNYFMPYAFPVRSVVTIHDVSFLSHPYHYSRRMRLWYARRIRQTVARADHILTVSEASRRNIIRHLGITTDRIHVIRPGCRFPEGDTVPTIHLRGSDSKVFLYIGTIEPRKNILNMLQGFRMAKLPGWQLLLAGRIHCSAGYWKRVRALIASDNRIRYLGYLTDARLSEALERCRFLVNLSDIEGFGMTVMEALLAGKECLVSEDPALLELVKGHGMAVPGTDKKRIAAGFETLSRGTTPIPGHIVGSLRAFYSWERFSQQLSALIEVPSPQDKWSAERGLPSKTEQAIVEGLVYSAVFSCPLTPVQLYRRLPGVKCAYPVFTRALNRLCYDYPELFRFDSRYIYLEPWVCSGKQRDADLADNAIFVQKNGKLIRWLSRLPWIMGIYYSGGTVHGSHLSGRDLDLFIVASRDRIWLLYTLLKGFAFLVRHTDILCFNYLVDESALTIHHQRDLYSAHQLACLRPASRIPEMPEPLAYNQWVFDFFPNLKKAGETPVRKEAAAGPMYWLNMAAMGWWTHRWIRRGLKNRNGGLLWDFHRIKLHTHDHRPFVYERYQDLLREVMCRIRMSGSREAISHNNNSFRSTKPASREKEVS